MAVNQNAVPGKGGERYVPVAERKGAESIVYFTRDLSAEGLIKIFDKVSAPLTGKIGIKQHTGEPKGPNIIPPAWTRELIKNRLPGATVLETNTFYDGDRYTTAQHRETLKINGWDDIPVDIMDEEGTAMLPVKGGKWFTEMSVGKHMLQYDSLLTLTHFKGHTMGGFGGSNKTLGIGCADGQIGKAMIHKKDGNDWGVVEEELMEKISESTKATIDFFGEHNAFINVMRNISVSCDCEGVAAEPVVTPNVGILASLDILAVDQACVDLIYALSPEDGKAMRERIETRHGHRQLSYREYLGIGSRVYRLIDLDHDEAPIQPADAVRGVVPFKLFDPRK